MIQKTRSVIKGRSVQLKKYYNNDSCGVVKCGDVLQKLSKMKNNSFDGAIVDPPYNIGKNFGNNEDSMPIDEYVLWSQQWLSEILRVVKTSSPIFVYGFAEILAHIAVKHPIKDQHWLVWHYTNKTVPTSQFWQRSHESILCIWKGKRPNLVSINELREPYTDTFVNNCAGKPRKDTLCRYGTKGQATIYNAHPKGALPRDVIKIPALAGGAGMVERWFYCKTCKKIYEPRALKQHVDHEVLKHPTQKPSALSEKLILSMTKAKKGRILIPFLGSGSECVVAKKLGVKFVGIDINPEYAALASGWLWQT